MVKTIKEMRDKAMALQGDYLAAYEDMLAAFEEYVENRAVPLSTKTVVNLHEQGRLHELLLLSRFLGLDSE
jgi:hypothetical protein